jgi:hypothetical protein
LPYRVQVLLLLLLLLLLPMQKLASEQCADTM